MQLFPWPGEKNSGLLAVVQYDFPGADPALSCPSIGLLVHLRNIGGSWHTRSRFLLETTHHHTLQSVALVDLTGSRAPDLVIESDYGGAGLAASTLQVFDLARGAFDEILCTDSRSDSHIAEPQGVYTQTVDIDLTLHNRSRQICLSRTTLAQDGKRLDPPNVSHPCYPRGFGVDAADISEGNKMLSPVR